MGPEAGKQYGEMLSVAGDGKVKAEERKRLNGSVKVPVTEAEVLSECETYGARTNPRVRTHIAKKRPFVCTKSRFCYGRRVGVRTPDPLIKSQLLYQLSYAPIIINQNGI